MSLSERLNEDMKQAMKNKDKFRLTVGAHGSLCNQEYRDRSEACFGR